MIDIKRLQQIQQPIEARRRGQRARKPVEKPTHRVLTTTQRSQHRWGQLWEEVLGKHPGRAGGSACMCVVMRAWGCVCLFQRDVGGQRDQIWVWSLPTFPSDCASPFLWDAASPYGCSWSGQLDKLWLREEGPRRAMTSFIHIGASPSRNLSFQPTSPLSQSDLCDDPTHSY